METTVALCAAVLALTLASQEASAEDTPSIEQFVEGQDGSPRVMTEEERNDLNDPFAKLVLSRSPLPSDLNDVLDRIDQANGNDDKLPTQASYVVGESGQIPPQVLPVNRRDFRVVITRGKTDDEPPILISAPAGERNGLLEIMSWDDKKKAFNFYRRVQPNTWRWKGDSGHAISNASANKSCFRCHINGAPVMKELEVPWNNWSTMSVSIPNENVPEQIRNSSLFKDKANANQLEQRVVRPWTRTWMKQRVAMTINSNDEKVHNVKLLMRHLFSNTTVNLASSPQTARSTENPLRLPIGFFINSEALSDVFPDTGIPSVSRELFNQIVVDKYDFRLSDGDIEFAGDTHFSFLVPVASLEDLQAVREMISQGIVSKKFGLCVNLVDFMNPVYSSSREKLWRKYVPDEADYKNGTSDLPSLVAAAIELAVQEQSLPESSPESQFMRFWKLSPAALETEANRVLKDYFNSIHEQLATAAGFDSYVQLAEARRRRFAMSKLNEFPLLLPKNDIPFGLEMRANGTVLGHR